MANQKKPARRRKIAYLPSDKVVEIEKRLAKQKEGNPDVFNLPASSHTVEQLTEYFAREQEGSKRILPKERRCYVLYLRKSTDDESKQVRSLEDQRSECLELAEAQGITIREEDILEESASAKISGNRPIFDDMIMGFKTGKYHGLISWSPDRISRNMKEAGEVIEMIDHEQIQDLQFRTYQFENNPNGKMMLGILFATSKQYSDKLSVDVKRGTSGNIKEGKYNGVTKKGYYVDASTGYFIPDGYNWDLLRQSVIMRLQEGKSNIEVAEFLNSAYFSERKDQDEPYKVVRVDKQMVGDLFEDPFYFGLYRYGNNLTNLAETYDFLPLMTPDEYIALNKGTAASYGEKHVGNSVNAKKLGYGLLRGKVICDYCDLPMQFQHQPIKKGKNKGRWVISFYCRNTNCQRYKAEENREKGIKLKKSIRAKYVSSAIEWTLRHLTKNSKEAYQLYIERLKSKHAQEIAIAKRKLSNAKKDVRTNTQHYMRYQQFQVDHPEDYKKHHNGKLEHYQKLVDIAKHNKKTSEQELERLGTSLPSEQDFYELIDSYLKTLLNTNDLVEQDTICNELVSNLRAANDSISEITLNPPYNLLADLPKISSGRGERTRTFDLRVPNAAR